MQDGMWLHRRFRSVEQTLRLLCAGDAEQLAAALRGDGPLWRMSVTGILVGGSLYGFTLGLWQWGTLQPLYVALKVPLLFLLVALGNGLLNGMLAQRIGLPLGFRESLGAVLLSFAILALILGSLFPVVSFFVFSIPARDGNGVSLGYNISKLFHVVLIAFAGIMAHLRLHGLLFHLTNSRRVARQALFAWLMGNLLLGSQLSWNLRPFIGSPQLRVQFLRPDAFQGNFFESVLHALDSFRQP
jgi:hypothetical protein